MGVITLVIVLLSFSVVVAPPELRVNANSRLNALDPRILLLDFNDDIVDNIVDDASVSNNDMRLSNDNMRRAFPFINSGGGKALRLTGTVDDYLIRNEMNNFPTTVLTVAFWMKSDQTWTAPIRNSDGAGLVSYAVGNGNSAANEFLLFYYAKSGVIKVAVDHDGGRTFQTGVFPAPTLFNDQWHHVVATWNSTDGNVSVYVDGAFIGSQRGIATGRSIQGQGTLVLGQDQDSKGGGFDPKQAYKGFLDYVQIYKEVKTKRWAKGQIEYVGRCDGSLEWISSKKFTSAREVASSSSRRAVSITSWGCCENRDSCVEASPGGSGYFTCHPEGTTNIEPPPVPDFICLVFDLYMCTQEMEGVQRAVGDITYTCRSEVWTREPVATSEICTGGSDEDLDTLIDCADDSCDGNAACQPVSICNEDVDPGAVIGTAVNDATLCGRIAKIKGATQFDNDGNAIATGKICEYLYRGIPLLKNNAGDLAFSFGKILGGEGDNKRFLSSTAWQTKCPDYIRVITNTNDNSIPGWDRTPRPLTIEEAKRCIDSNPAAFDSFIDNSCLAPQINEGDVNRDGCVNLKDFWAILRVPALFQQYDPLNNDNPGKITRRSNFNRDFDLNCNS